MSSNSEIAKTILEQLGGRAFAYMCGVKNLTAIERGLSFRTPGTLTRNRINYVRITLEPDDTYTVEFHVIRGKTCRRVSDWQGVYCDDLAPLFREQTGLATRFPVFAAVDRVSRLLDDEDDTPDALDPSNTERAAWASVALHAHSTTTGGDDEDAVTDLLANLMHYCDANGIDFANELRKASNHYRAESKSRLC